MSYNIYLDDWRNPVDTLISKKPLHLKKIISETEWEIVRSYKEFVYKIETKGLPNMISFDHDLADVYIFKDNERQIIPPGEAEFDYNRYTDDEKTGYHCAKWLVDYCLDNNKKLPSYCIHSDNQVGSENIRSYLENFKKHQNEQI